MSSPAEVLRFSGGPLDEQRFPNVFLWPPPEALVVVVSPEREGAALIDASCAGDTSSFYDDDGVIQTALTYSYERAGYSRLPPSPGLIREAVYELADDLADTPEVDTPELVNA